MKILFLGLLFNPDAQNEFLKISKKGLQNQANTYQWNFIQSMNTFADKEDIRILSYFPFGSYPISFKKLFIKGKKSRYKEFEFLSFSFINLPLIKKLVQFLKIKNQLKNYLNVNKNEVFHVFVYSIHPDFIKIVFNKKIKSRVKVYFIVPDLLPPYGIYKKSLISKISLNRNIKLMNAIIKSDGFVFLTEAMNDLINTKYKPYIIIEGIANNLGLYDYDKNDISFNNKKIILYTGALESEFGILELLETFSSLDIDNIELWICGSGSIQEIVLDFQENDSRVRYFGYLTKQEVGKIQSKATILINPRQSNGEYVNYSFPSKIIEYMVSGKPTLSYSLPGIPKEYNKYLILIDNFESLKESLIYAINLNKDDLDLIGLEAKEWISQNKNIYATSNKIIKLLNEDL